MSGTCDTLDPTLRGQEHTLAEQEPTEAYWVTLKISTSIYFVSVTDGGRRMKLRETFLPLHITSVHLFHQPDIVELPGLWALSAHWFIKICISNPLDQVQCSAGTLPHSH